MKPYEFLIVKNPTGEEKKAGKAPSIVVQPKLVMAPDDKAAAMLAGREIPESEVAAIDRLQVYVRPF